MDNSMSGTYIADLRNQQEIDNIKKQHELNNYNVDRMTQYGANQNLQYEQGHNDVYSITQTQQDPYYKMNNVVNYPNNPEIVNKPTTTTNNGSVAPKKPQATVTVDEDILYDLVNEDFEDNSKSNYTGLLKDSLIILVIYIILSLPAVQTTITKFIPMSNPGFGDKIPMATIVIYGLILVILVALVKNLLKRF